MTLSFIEKIGIPPSFVWGYTGLLLFMIGDGVETSFLSRLFLDLGFSQTAVGAIFTFYGVTVAAGAYLAGALSDLWGRARSWPPARRSGLCCTQR